MTDSDPNNGPGSCLNGSSPSQETKGRANNGRLTQWEE